MTILISLKQELEAVNENKIHLTTFGATESHLLAKELAEAGVGVVVGPVHPFPDSWEIRRMLPGPPLSTIGSLLDYNVTVGILPVHSTWNPDSKHRLLWIQMEEALNMDLVVRHRRRSNEY
ncbi:MAG: hypothetical protein NXY57DRAFT_1001001 [Lentinula lateritia]|uniref:Glycosyltransferase family 1 protein n=1 Tax=Lentinula lateritia TaxID=40482 RepID=A0ABQ8V832_9AGAR|nr:MAG: hypothetical protein NXY57DRAFT_1001001 [Lentinula lateritia]KAJ4474555.1 hypothetical protein C8R41DRAFT_848009 [Lentinula lateritia]